MVQDTLRKFCRTSSACRRISCFLYGTWRFITVSTKLAIGLYLEPAEPSSLHRSQSP